MIEPWHLLVELEWCPEYENKPKILTQIGHQLDGPV